MAMLCVLSDFDVGQLNDQRPANSSQLWTFDGVRAISQSIQAYLDACAAGQNDSLPEFDRKLLVASFATPALDLAHLQPDSYDPQVKACLTGRQWGRIGMPMLCHRYDRPVGCMWVNTKCYAGLSAGRVQHILNSPRGCDCIDVAYKISGHLLTTEPSLLPTSNAQAMDRLGAKHRLGSAPIAFTDEARSAILGALRDPVQTMLALPRCTNSHLRAITLAAQPPVP